MTFDCTDCKKYMNCVKNSEAWETAKPLYTENTALRLSYMNRIFKECGDRKIVLPSEKEVSDP